MPYLEAITSILTMRSTTRRRAKFEKMKITQLVMKLHALYGTRKFITLESNTRIFRDVTSCSPV
jgi:hypothetical protein